MSAARRRPFANRVDSCRNSERMWLGAGLVIRARSCHCAVTTGVPQAIPATSGKRWWCTVKLLENRMHGRPPVVIEPYDPTWPMKFETERTLLESVLAPWLVGPVVHIGSTSVPGLAA